MTPTKLDKIKVKEKAYYTVSALYSKRFENYQNEQKKLSDLKKISTIKT